MKAQLSDLIGSHRDRVSQLFKKYGYRINNPTASQVIDAAVLHDNFAGEFDEIVGFDGLNGKLGDIVNILIGKKTGTGINPDNTGGAKPVDKKKPEEEERILGMSSTLFYALLVAVVLVIIVVIVKVS